MYPTAEICKDAWAYTKLKKIVWLGGNNADYHKSYYTHRRERNYPFHRFEILWAYVGVPERGRRQLDQRRRW